MAKVFVYRKLSKKWTISCQNDEILQSPQSGQA